MEGAGTGEVGLFIDLENIRYSFLNVYQIEPNISGFIEKARKHGRVSAAMAYADFNEHPQWVGAHSTSRASPRATSRYGASYATDRSG